MGTYSLIIVQGEDSLVKGRVKHKGFNSDMLILIQEGMRSSMKKKIFNVS